MKSGKPIFYALTSLLLGVLIAGLVWYRMPVAIEDLNRLHYCGCGYAVVEFNRGVVIMKDCHHDNPKPGDVIGHYSISGNVVEMDIIFNGNTHHETMQLDHVGLVTPSRSLLKYHAINGDSWRINIYYLLDNIGL